MVLTILPVSKTLPHKEIWKTKSNIANFLRTAFWKINIIADSLDSDLYNYIHIDLHNLSVLQYSETNIIEFSKKKSDILYYISRDIHIQHKIQEIIKIEFNSIPLQTDSKACETLSMLYFFQEQNNFDKICTIDHAYLAEITTAITANIVNTQQDYKLLHIITSRFIYPFQSIFNSMLNPSVVKNIFYQMLTIVNYVNSSGIRIHYLDTDIFSMDDSYNIQLQYFYNNINLENNITHSNYRLTQSFIGICDIRHTLSIDPTHIYDAMSDIVYQNLNWWIILQLLYKYYTGDELLWGDWGGIENEHENIHSLYILLGRPTQLQLNNILNSQDLTFNDSFPLHVTPEIRQYMRDNSLEAKLANPKFPELLKPIYRECFSYDWDYKTPGLFDKLIQSEYFSDIYKESDFVTCSSKYDYDMTDFNFESLCDLIKTGPRVQLSLPPIIV